MKKNKYQEALDEIKKMGDEDLHNELHKYWANILQELVDRENPNKTAKEMFEDLGYELHYEDEYNIAYRYSSVMGWHKDIIIHKRNDGIFIEESVRKGDDCFISHQEAKAIKKQVDEIGWVK